MSRDVHSCQIPPSGGHCLGCGYPRARAHPASVSEALDRVDALYVAGTALLVADDASIAPGWVRIDYRDGRVDTHQIAGIIEGLTDWQCYLRWSTNRAFVERGKPPPFELSPPQIERGRSWVCPICGAHAGQLMGTVDCARCGPAPIRSGGPA